MTNPTTGGNEANAAYAMPKKKDQPESWKKN